jgi:hypothetical protein
MQGNHVFVCPVERRDGDICGRPADDDMPITICSHHAYKVYRRVDAQVRARLAAHFAADEAARAPVRMKYREPGRDVVYYVRLPGDLIKIGTSRALRSRLTGLLATPADLLAAEPGGRELEAERHRQFRRFRYDKTERFRSEPELLAHIEQLRQTVGVPQVAKYPDNVVWRAA